jgi:hypothetical protein
VIENSMKFCTACGENNCEFGKRKTGKDGLQSVCKICINRRTREWQKANPEKCSANNRRWRANNPEKKKVADKKGRQNWERKNRDMVNAKTARRRASKLNATPKWLTELHFEHMKLFYEASAKLTSELGVKFHVDHIVPLQNDQVCGLHVPWNLQVIPESENCSKQNKIIFTEIERSNAV